MGGWSYVIHDGLDTYYKYGWAFGTTNNKMELKAAISVVRSMLRMKFHRRPILVCTDSQYVTNGAVSEVAWARNPKVMNRELWEMLWKALDHFDCISFAWVRGHSGHHYNEMADRLAHKGRQTAIRLSEEAR